jgi:hypothetical protein
MVCASSHHAIHYRVLRSWRCNLAHLAKNTSLDSRIAMLALKDWMKRRRHHARLSCAGLRHLPQCELKCDARNVKTVAVLGPDSDRVWEVEYESWRV